jgi:para-nitrobenzyl esterase
VKCPLTALDDRLPSDLQYVRSYFLRDGHLFLSLLAEQGTYEFEPVTSQSQVLVR